LFWFVVIANRLHTPGVEYHGNLKYDGLEDNKQSKIAMSHCYFRLFAVFEITIFKIAMVEVIEKCFVLCNDKVLFQQSTFYFLLK